MHAALLGLMMMTGVAAAAGPLTAGVASRDITPEPGLAMWGYSDRPGVAKGTLDPLYTKAIVFNDGAASVALVTLDLGRVPPPDVCRRVRERILERGVGHLFITASHTHQAPAVDIDTPYLKILEDHIVDCVTEAAAAAAPVQIGAGRADIDINFNRRKLLPDGRCLMVWRNEEHKPTGIADKEAAIIKIADANGKTIAVLVHYACHPVVLGQDNVEYSADYCGEMARLVKESIGAECLFLQGACGDINPYLDKTPTSKGGVEAMRGVGRECADAILAALDPIAIAAAETPSVKIAEKPVEVGLRWDFSDPEVETVIRAAYGPAIDRLKLLPADLKVPLSVLLLNDAIALVGMPGEVFVQYQLDLKQRSPLKDTFLVGYTNEYHAYFPTVKDAAAGGYGGATATYVGLGAADKLASEALIEIGKLTGKIHPVRADDFKLLEEENP